MPLHDVFEQSYSDTPNTLRRNKYECFLVISFKPRAATLRAHQQPQQQHTVDCIMGGTRIWKDDHTRFCFGKFTSDSDDNEKWCVVRTTDEGTQESHVPNAPRGRSDEDDPAKRWLTEAKEQNNVLWGPVTLQIFRSNIKNTAKKWFESPHNAANAVNPPRDDSVPSPQPESNHDGDDAAVAQDDDEASDQGETGGVIMDVDGQGCTAKLALPYVLGSYNTSTGTPSVIKRCHIVIQSPSGMKISSQNHSFCQIRGKRVLNLRFTLSGLWLDKVQLVDVLRGFSNYGPLPDGTEHPAVTAMLIAAEREQTDSLHYDMVIPLLDYYESICAITGLMKKNALEPDTSRQPVVSHIIIQFWYIISLLTHFVSLQLLHYSQPIARSSDEGTEYPIGLIHIELTSSPQGESTAYLPRVRVHSHSPTRNHQTETVETGFSSSSGGTTRDATSAAKAGEGTHRRYSSLSSGGNVTSSSSSGGTTSAARAEEGDGRSSSSFDMQSMMKTLLRVETLETRMEAVENQVSELKLSLGEPSKWDEVKVSVKDMVSSIQVLAETWLIKNNVMLSRIDRLQESIEKMEEESTVRGELLLHVDNVQRRIDNQMKSLGERVEGDGAALLGALNEARDHYTSISTELEAQLQSYLDTAISVKLSAHGKFQYFVR